MGLDISAYRSVPPPATACAACGRVGVSEDDADVNVFDNGFGRLGSLAPGPRMGMEESDHSFSAGSYGGYNAWRAQLAALTGTTDKAIHTADPEPAGPFVELINFSDCEGWIGPEVSSKLAADFTEWRIRAVRFASAAGGDNGEWFLRVYDHFRKAFEIAAEGGAVYFH